MKNKIKDIIIRAFKTFIQGFLATLVVLLQGADYSDLSILKSILVGALAGGISAVMNIIIKAFSKTELTNSELEELDGNYGIDDEDIVFDNEELEEE